MILTLLAGGGIARARPGEPPAGMPAKDKPKPKSEREQADEQVFSRLAKAWAATLAGEHSQAITIAQPITKLSDPRYRWAAVEAVHVQARAYHQAGSARGRSRAAQMWKQIQRLSKDPATLSRIEIAKALSLEAASEPGGDEPTDATKLTAAIGVLEPLLKAKRWNLATVEAAIDLSRLYIHAKRFADAKKTLDYLVAYLGNARNIRAMELPPALATPFINAAKAALKNLKYDRNAGLAEFQAAEKLRHDKKFAQAAQAYQALIKNFPQSDYAPRSDLHIGDCLLGLGQTARAIAHWEKFIAPAPAGPWRGQAYVSIIDYYLQERLDLPQAGKYATQARNALPTALADKPTPAAPRITAAASWQLVAFDIHLRVGLVTFCQGQSAIAAKAFQSAKALTKNKETAKSLTTLIATTKAGKPVIPEDCRASGSRGRDEAKGEAGPSQSQIWNSKSQISLALSLGTINLLIHRIDQADAFFDRVLGTPAIPAKRGVPARRARPPMPGATPAQRAYAIFGRGATLQASNKPDQAKEYFQASIQAHKQATWHDETLYRLATIIQDAADAEFGAAIAATPSAPAAKNAKPPASPTPAQKQAIAKANKQRLAALVKAKSAALPYWHEIIQRYPKSPRCEQAFYNAGILLYELAEAADAAGQRTAQSEANWKKAAFMLDKFCESYPKSPLAGDAYVKLIDVTLERLFDLEFSNAVLLQAVTWAKGIAAGKSDLPAAPSLPAWCLAEQYPTYASLTPILYDCYQRAGLVAYLRQQKPQAIAMLKEAANFDDSFRKKASAETATDRLVAIVKGEKEPLTPAQLLDALEDGRQRTGILLGDLALMTFDPERAANLYERLLNANYPFPRPTANIESYVLLRIGQAMQFQRKRDEAMAYLKRLYDPRFKKYPWTADGIFRIGTWTQNAGAGPDEAMSHWAYVCKNFPGHPEAERSLFYIGLTAVYDKQYAKAVEAFREYLKRYPKGPSARRVRDRELPKTEQLLKGESK